MHEDRRVLKGRPLWALGTMSGTSLDGVDAAMLQTDGHRIIAFGDTAYRPYGEGERTTLRAALGRWPNEAGVAEASAVVTAAHAECLRGFSAAEVVGFHGQTLAHDPGGRGTHQAGDGAVLAQALGLPVVWDFRSADVGLGGQGAPLAPFFHHALARLIGEKRPVAFLNLGGVGNLTWADPAREDPSEPGACIAFDTGPANAPVNDLMRQRLGAERDEGGAMAAKGRVDARIVREFLTHPHFLKIPPKSLDRNAFHALLSRVRTRTTANAAATLTACAAAAVAAGFSHFPARPEAVLVCGGGRHNRTFMKMLADRLPCPVRPVEAAGLDGDMLEAQAFAYLAVRVLNGLPTSSPGTTGVRAAVGGGQISRPS